MENSVTSTFGQVGGREKRLGQATVHVSHLWFPVNSELLKKIKKGIEAGIYDLDVDFLVAEIKTDFSLFTYCLREITKEAQKSGTPLPEGASPIDILKLAGLPRLKAILSVEERRISAHSFETSSEIQAARLQEAMLSATTAEVLADSQKIDPNLGYAAGLLRQLGLTLIAWNYPTVYRKVMTSLKEKGDVTVDLALSQALGFSPGVLGASLARQWKLSPVVRSAMGDTEAKNSLTVEQEQAVGTVLQKVCEVGEALARANDPEHYPTASADWKTAKAEIEAKLGFEGFKIIGERVTENFQNYVSLLPQTFNHAIEIDAEGKLHHVEEETVLKSNAYIKHLQPELKKRIKDLYSEINAGSVSKDTIRSLVKEIMPLAGFSGGAIYTIDPGNMTLVPRTRIGAVELREVAILPYNEDSSATDPVIAAFKCNTPIMETGIGDTGELTLISCALGEKQKVGVLYLETPNGGAEDKNDMVLLTFKAIRQTLCDCLTLS